MNTFIYTTQEDAASVLRQDPKGSEAVEILESMMVDKAPCIPESVKAPAPIIILEGLDGVGKTTLVQNLKSKLGQNTTCLKSPSEQLMHLRPYFDGQPKAMRRAFYAIGNYACALRIRSAVADGPVIVDRFWPSTVAYAIAHDCQTMPDEVPEALEIPVDLSDLLPKANPVICLLVELSEAERARRVRARSTSMPAGFALAITMEEEELERSSSHRARLTAAYRSLSIDDHPLTACDASGTEEEVAARAFNTIESKIEEKLRLVPKSVNWHYTRQCNYSCKFCFHTAKTSFFLPSTPQGMEESKKCLTNLREAGMMKLNFSGGEPFLQAKELGELCRFCKEDLCLDSDGKPITVSIISNGSKIQKKWLQKFGRYVDILAISCDSFVEESNILIGRGKGMHLAQLQQVRDWCTEFDIPFKLNSVINKHNVHEDMNAAIERLAPIRWKVFQCLIIDGENAGADALRDAQELVITDEQFRAFEHRHGKLKCLVPESNEKMKDSYLILDEELRFLNCTGGKKTPSRSIRDVSVNRALQEAGFDEEMFLKRGGIYDWSRTEKPRDVDIEDIDNGCSGKTTKRKMESNEQGKECNFNKVACASRQDNRKRNVLAVVIGGVVVAGAVRLFGKPGPLR